IRNVFYKIPIEISNDGQLRIILQENKSGEMDGSDGIKRLGNLVMGSRKQLEECLAIRRRFDGHDAGQWILDQCRGTGWIICGICHSRFLTGELSLHGKYWRQKSATL